MRAELRYSIQNQRFLASEPYIHSRSNQNTIWEVFLDKTDFYTNPSFIVRGGRETSFVGPSRVMPIPKVETIENRRNSKKKTVDGVARPNIGACIGSPL